MITMKDVARAAGVSRTAVSYAFSDSNNISAETKKNILSIAAAMGYQPHKFAQSLRTQKSLNIGVVVEDISVFLSPDIINGICEEGESLGYSIVLTNLRTHKKIGDSFYKFDEYIMEVNHIIKNNIAPYVDGIIYVGIHTRNVKGVADNCEKPVVYCYCYAGENSPCAMIEQEKMSYSIIRHFYELGHRNISIIAGRVDSGVTFARLAGCKKAFDELQFPVENYHIVFGDWEVEKGYTLAKKLLTVKNPPTAIFAMNDKMASGVLKACRELNIHVPDDLSVVGFDNRSFSAYCTPALSTVDLSLNELGKESVLLLMDYINNPQTPPKQIIIDGKYLERETVARAHD